MLKNFIYDIKTKNISFLQTAKDLKVLGIKNYMFFLILYDVSLQGVDPYDPTLDEETRMRIINECIINPWYFLREVCRIADQGNPKGIPYRINRGNLAATFCYLNGLGHYLVLPRQIGKTQSSIAIMNWSFLFGTTNSEFMFINKKNEDALNNLKRLKEQRDLLPDYLQFKITLDEAGKVIKGSDNVKSLKNAINGNTIVTKPSARSEEHAEGIGRGSTQPIQYFDEVEFTPHIYTIVTASGPAYRTASENAKRNGAAYCRIFTSTPGDLDSKPCQEALKIINGACTWTEKFYDWAVSDIENFVDENSENGIIYIEYQYPQLGLGEEWFASACKSVLNDPKKIKREIFLQRMRGSSDSPFEPEELEVIESKKGKIIEEIFINKFYKLDIYEKIDKKQLYLIGVDCASGGGGDNSAVTVFDPYTQKAIAEFRSPLISYNNLKHFLYILIKRHIPRGVLCIERNHTGDAIIDDLRRTDIAGNIYFDSNKDLVGDGINDRLDSKGMLQLDAARRKMYGVYTTTKARNVMMDILFRYVEEFKESFHTEFIIGDLFALIKDKKGKIVAGPGFHDDSIMSFLICLYVYHHGNNLSRFGYVKGSLPNAEDSNKGLEYDDISDLPENVKQMFSASIPRPQSAYDEKFVQEIQKARREALEYDRLTRPVNMNEDIYDDANEMGSFDTISLDFFDELNDF